MNKLLITTFSTLLTLTSATLAISPQVNALSSNLNQESSYLTEMTSLTNPQPIVSESFSENMIAQIVCETHTNGFRTMSCCVDSAGNWACAWN